MGREEKANTTTQMIHEKSKYFERFKRLNTLEDNAFVLTSDNMLIEKLGRVETTTKSGIIIPVNKIETYKTTAYDDVAEVGIVLKVGPGQYFENGELLPPKAKVGDVVLYGARVDWFSQFLYMNDYEPYTIGLVRDSEVFGIFAHFKGVFEVLNGKA